MSFESSIFFVESHIEFLEILRRMNAKGQIYNPNKPHQDFRNALPPCVSVTMTQYEPTILLLAVAEYDPQTEV